MAQPKLTAAHFLTQSSHVPDAVLDANDPINELKSLAGINNPQKPNWQKYDGMNISRTGMEKRELEKKHNIQPGTPEWFKLWFSLPYLTGEKPHSSLK